MTNLTIDVDTRNQSTSIEPTPIELFCDAVKQAQKDLHAAGSPYVVAAEGGKGYLKVFPDGHSEFFPYRHPRPF
jgi:hypothetical protein